MKKTITQKAHYIGMKLMAIFFALLLISGQSLGQYSGTGTFNKVTSLSNLTDGYYVIVNSGDAQAMNNVNGSNNYFGNSAVLPSSGVLTNPATTIVWRIETNGTGRSIYNEVSSKFVSYSGSSDAAYESSTAGTDNQRWTFTYASDVFTVTNIASNTRMLQYNASYPMFACYTSSQQKLLLYKYTVPTITTPAPTSLSGFATITGTASGSQSFTVEGKNLTANLIVTAPADYEVRENGTGSFGSSVSFIPSSGNVASKTIEVRIASSAGVGTPSGNVVCSSTGASSKNVAVSGTVSALGSSTLTTQAPSSISTTTVTGNGNITATGGYNPTVRGFCWDYSVNADPDINDSKTVENGTFSTGAFTGSITGLSYANSYKVRAYATNSVGTSYGSAVTFFTLSNEPTAHATNFSATAVSLTQINLVFDSAGTIPWGAGYLILQKTGSAPTGAPSDGNTYTVGTTIGDGTVAAVITAGNIITTQISGLSAGTHYYFKIFPYGWNLVNASTINYKTDGSVSGTDATTDTPLDASSEVYGPALGSQPNPLSISSLATNDGNALRVFDLSVIDYATLDAQPTKITQITIKPGTHNTANWANAIQGVKLSTNGGSSFLTIGTPVISASSIIIPITSGNLNIPSGNAVTVSLFVYLNASGFTDNQVLEFKVDATAASHGFTADASGSAFLTTFAYAPVSNQILINVVATKLIFTTAPSTTACPNTGLATQPEIKATDANGIVDTDFTGAVTLTNSGSLGMSNNVITPSVSGVATFTNFQFTETGNVTLSTSNTSSVTDAPATASIAISVSNAPAQAASTASASSVLTWTNPPSCYDEIMIVAKASAAVTVSPTGDGTSYTANLAYSSGTGFDGGFVVYKGTSSSQTVTGLTNGTVYYYSFFTRKGSSWSSGAIANATPAAIPTAVVTSRPTHIDLASATSESAVLMTLSYYASNLAKYRLYNASNQYNPWNESTDTYISSVTYSDGPLVVGTPTSNTSFWIIFQRGNNNTDVASYRDYLDPYTSDYQTVALPSAATIASPFNLTGSFIGSGSYDNTIKHVVLAYNGSTLVSAAATTLSTGAFTVVCPGGTTIDKIEIRAVDNTLIETKTGSWTSTTATGNIPDNSVYTGTGNWSTALNWSNGVPGSTTDVTISGSITITSAAECNNLVIGNGGQLTINNGITLTPAGTITIEDGGSLIDNTVTQSVLEATVKRNLTAANWSNGLDGWHLVSSPNTSQTITGNWINGNYDFYGYDEVTNTWLNQKTGANNLTDFTPGKGYLVAYETDINKKFQGTLKNINVSVDLTKTTGYGEGWNLLGNPFPSNLIWNDGSSWTMTNIEGIAKIWQESTQSYIDLDPAGIIPANQGFWVKANAAVSGFVIPQAARTHTAQAFNKTSQNEILTLIVTTSVNTTQASAKIVLNDQATNAYDMQYEGSNLYGGIISPNIFSVLSDGHLLSTNAIPTPTNGTIVNLGFKAKVNGAYTITADGLANFTTCSSITLEDLKTNTTQNLMQNPVYNFTAATTDNSNRFILHFAASLGVNEVGKPNTGIYAYDNNIYVNNSEKAKQIYVYNALGQLIKTIDKVNGLQKINMNGNVTGYYILKVITDKNVYSEKVLVK